MTLRHRIVKQVRQYLTGRGIDAARIAGAPGYAALIQSALERGSLLLNGFEAATVMHFVVSTEGLDGAIAELGTFAGGSARLICAVKGDTPLYLFDTFEGLPELASADAGGPWRKGMFAYSESAVREYLAEFNEVHLLSGLFPSTAGPIAAKRFRFVHLDADLYEPTKAGLDFFYPRMASQGVILIHDSHAAGPSRALREFLADKPERLFVQPAGHHSFIVKG